MKSFSRLRIELTFSGVILILSIEKLPKSVVSIRGIMPMVLSLNLTLLSLEYKSLQKVFGGSLIIVK